MAGLKKKLKSRAKKTAASIRKVVPGFKGKATAKPKRRRAAKAKAQKPLRQGPGWERLKAQEMAKMQSYSAGKAISETEIRRRARRRPGRAITGTEHDIRKYFEGK